MTGQATFIKLIGAAKEELAHLQSMKAIRRNALSAFKKELDHKLIKVVIGPRRAGKSVFARQLLEGKNFAYVNFDDDDLLAVYSSKKEIDLIKALDQVYGEYEFILLDEIQNIEGWELLVNKLQRRGHNLIVTGSNANLLSQELSTHLTGRYVEVEILPFSWSEYQVAKSGVGRLEDYLKDGGFPEICFSSIDRKNYLDNLASSIVLKDIVRRKKIRNSEQVLRLLELLRNQFSLPQSYEKIKTGLQFSSKTTTEKYVSYLKEAYLILELQRYSPKYRQQIRSPRKYIPVDLGLCIDQKQFADSFARRLESFVFLELHRGVNARNCIYSYHTKSGFEVDYIIEDRNKFSELIQVCYALNDPSTIERETRSLVQASRELGCKNLKIITWDEKPRVIEVDKVRIDVLGALDWLESFNS